MVDVHAVRIPEETAASAPITAGRQLDYNVDQAAQRAGLHQDPALGHTIEPINCR